MSPQHKRISIEEAKALQLRVINAAAKGMLGVVAATTKIAECDLREFTTNYAWLVPDEFQCLSDYFERTESNNG